MSKRLKGLYQNCEPIDMPEGFYRDAQNIILDESQGALVTEKGMINQGTLPNDMELIGTVLLDNDDVVLFGTRDDFGIISLFKHEDGSVENIIANSGFNFSKDHTIQGDFYIDKYGDRNIVWVDGINPARFVNIDNPTDSLDVESFSLFPTTANTPNVLIDSINNNSGNLATGSYYFAIAYKHFDGTVTNFYNIAGPAVITQADNSDQREFFGSNAEQNTSKSITLNFNNLDIENYEFIKIAVIPKYNDIFGEVQLLPDIDISAGQFTYTGNESYTPGSLAEIQIDQAFYDNPSTIHIADDNMYLGNMNEKPDIGYQPYANSIRVNAKVEVLEDAVEISSSTTYEDVAYHDKENSYRDPVNVAYNKGYKREEVYAFYISWMLKEGGETKAYHIPGRQTVSSLNEKEAFNVEDITGKKFQFEDTSDVNIFSTNNMGYWENKNETYPDNDQWVAKNSNGTPTEDLRNKPVRHHKFLSIQKQSLNTNPFQSATDGYNVLGFELENVNIPAELEGKVTGYKIYYAKRTEENKRIIDQSLTIQNRVENGILRSNHANKPYVTSEPNIYYLHGLESLLNKTNISGISYVKAVKRCNEPEENDFFLSNNIVTNNFSTDTRLDITGLTKNDLIPTTDKFKKVKGIAYVDSTSESTFTSLSTFGIDLPINNNRGESKIVMQIEGDDYADESFGKPYYLLDLISYKEDLYLSFDQQVLEYTGYFHTNLDNLDSDIILGGDTFVSMYTFRANAVPSSGSDRRIGIHNVIIESSINPSYRSTGSKPHELFYPATDYHTLSALSWSEGRPAFNLNPYDQDIQVFDNYLEYNPDYSATNNIKFPGINSKQKRRVTTYPTRVIRNTNVRTFLPNDFIDLSTKRGDLIKLTTYNNILVPHMERSIVRTKGREELITDDIRAFLGSGDIFSVKPEDLIYTNDGFGGIKNKDHSISTPFGYYFYDSDSKQFFALTNDGLQDISEPIKPFAREDINSVICGYDPYYERILFSTDTTTISYSPKIKNWTSFHSYLPSRYFNTKEHLYSSKFDNPITTVYKHNVENPLLFYDEFFDSYIEYISNNDPSISKRIQSLFIISDRTNSDGDIVNDTFDKFIISNTDQASGTIDITPVEQGANNPYISNARRILNKWFINQFRDITDIPINTPEDDKWKYKKRFEDHFHKVKLIKTGGDGHTIKLYSTDLLHKNSIR